MSSLEFELSEEDKQLLQDLVDEFEFTENIKEACECKKCKKVAIKHYKLESCSHFICLMCYRTVENQLCPVEGCNKKFTSCTQDENLENDVFHLKVKCEFHSNGCDEIVYIGEFLKHSKECDFSTENLLPNIYSGDSNKEKILASKVASSERDISRLQRVMGQQEDEIKKCKQTITDLHMKILQQQQEMIEYVKASGVPQPEKIQSHSSSITNAFTMYQRMDPAYTTAHLTSYIWRIPDIKAKLEFMKTGQDQDISCKPLFIKELGITMNAALFVIDPYKHLSMYMGFAKSDEADTSNMTAYYHRRTVVILDQTENRERKDIIRIFEPGFGPKDAEEWMKEYLPNELAPISLLERDDTYIKNDILLIEIIVEPMFPLYRNFFSSNGMLHWVIDNYSYKKRLEKDNIVTCQRSDYFYNNPIGYRMQAELYLNGLGNLNIEKSLSINVIVKNGKWDSFIPNSYPRKITFIVFDQSDSEAKKHFTKVVTNPSGTFFNTAADLIPFEEIESPNSIYLKNDALCIDVLVERLEKGDGK